MPDAPSMPVTADELRLWRAAKGYSLREVADILQVNSPGTIKSWEDSRIDIPGPAEQLLRWLIRGEVPFETDPSMAGLGNVVRDDIGAVEMTVEAFEACVLRARDAGYASVTEWIASLVKAELGRGNDQGQPRAEQT